MNYKTEVQKKIVQLLKEVNGHGILELATGTGKTKIAIDYVDVLFKKFKRRKAPLRVLWAVPSEKLRDIDVPDEFIKWKKSYLLEYTTLICYASLKKIEADKFDLVVLDELHKITELNSSFFFDNFNQIERILGLTATKPHEEVKTNILERLNLHTLYKIGVEEAQHKNLISDFEIIIIKVPLSNYPLTVKTKNKTYSTTEIKRYKGLSSVINKYYDEGKVAPKNIIMARMRAIYNFKSKAIIAKNLIKSLIKDNRILLFTKSIEICDNIAGKTNTYHSKTNSKAYLKFLEGSSNLLGVVDSINEGVNLPDLDVVVIEQLNSQPREFIQRIGRGLRFKPGHTAKIYIIVSENTQDEKWMNDAIGDIPKERIKFESYKKYEDR
jgi:superfamily II DNA or RNA helicase